RANEMYGVPSTYDMCIFHADFYNWNRVKIRYCDSASFAGDAFDKGTGLYFRGQRIWEEAIRHLLSIGMASADRALLTGCSAGGLAAILHCDQFGAFFAGRSTTVKCLADAGLFLDAVDVSGGRSLRSYYGDIVAMQGVAPHLPPTCTDHLDATSVLLPSEYNRQHQDAHLLAQRSLRRLADRGKPGPKQS
uniref:Pectin acetylesterase n=1 Tax=Aegilops tauschii subsp. strangulata TaxID=200361 RepID=A0A453CH17_AEGTS